MAGVVVGLYPRCVVYRAISSEVPADEHVGQNPDCLRVVVPFDARRPESAVAAG